LGKKKFKFVGTQQGHRVPNKRARNGLFWKNQLNNSFGVDQKNQKKARAKGM